ncbi:MAG: phytanoyl-CoA dioxygenase family protein [Chitinophagales bacterium]|nr:phytanoyl-CoA dioxygenase family protein [Chitinophagales bacterium]
MRAIFKDPELQRRYEVEGYVVVPFYTEDDIKELKNIFNAMSSELEDRGFYISIMSKNVEYKKKVHPLIKAIAEKRAENILIDSEFISSSFAVKNIGDSSIFELHQGVSFTDEEKFDTYTAWTPLLDVDRNNGCLFVLPKSHRLWRQIKKTPDFVSPFRNIKEHLWNKYAVEIKMKAGEALIFNHNLIHGSLANHSNSIRIATLNAFKPKEAPLLLYTSTDKDPNNRELEVYQFHKDNYYTIDVLRKPDNIEGVELIGHAQEKILTFTEEDYDKMYEDMMAGKVLI